MTAAERALLLYLAEHMAALLDADAASLDATSSHAEQFRALMSKILGEAKAQSP